MTRMNLSNVSKAPLGRLSGGLPQAATRHMARRTGLAMALIAGGLALSLAGLTPTESRARVETCRAVGTPVLDFPLKRAQLHDLEAGDCVAVGLRYVFDNAASTCDTNPLPGGFSRRSSPIRPSS